ncbi:IS701 family transposase [Micromonospora sp. NPDC048999]|uniref:IS701 family transposase n=1 Tax=Micromonospora sp. NPDC048999 TaxID=3155391 RepID=UPI0033E81FCD
MSGKGATNEDFREFCADVFGTLGRTDQRQAAETYLYGLLNCTGRKSIRRLVAAAPGRSEQSLQQFINQSPWDPEPIRERLMYRLAKAVRPTAWVIEEVHFPKHGQYSAAVERQYVQSLGRVRNCQLAITVTLTAGRITVPVNWRLIVPDSWGRDHERRTRARMPSHELPRPYWQYHLEVLDDMALEWGMPVAPVVVDTSNRGNVEAFLGALELRRQPYLAQVASTFLVAYDQPARANHPSWGASPANGSAPTWQGTAGDLIARTGHVTRDTVEWRNSEIDSVMRSQFLQVPVRSSVPGRGAGASSTPTGARTLIAEWPLGKPGPRNYWITNMTDPPLPELVELAKLRELATPRIEEFAGTYGLRDYEGRTFAGWHHHVTLATAAYIYCLLDSPG